MKIAAKTKSQTKVSKIQHSNPKFDIISGWNGIDTKENEMIEKIYWNKDTFVKMSK